MPSPKAKVKAKAKAKAKPKVPSAATLMQEVHVRMDEMVAEYEKTMATYQKQYEDMVNEASRHLTAVAAPAPPKREPQALWHEESGEKLLVLNKEAADFFLNIFENVGVLAQELQKQLGSK